MGHKISPAFAKVLGEFQLPDFLKPELLTLPLWAGRYLEEEVAGVQSENTLLAKQRDLTAFIKFYYEHNGHMALDQWLPRDTQDFLRHLEKQGRSATTINRVFATLRKFANWVHEQPQTPFVYGLPTKGIKDLTTEESECIKLEQREIYALQKAADNLVLTETRANARPVRNRAIMQTLYFTGLRVSELVALNRKQYDGKYFRNVKRKGKARTKQVFIPTECRRYIDEYIEKERALDDPKGKAPALFLADDNAMSRKTVNHLLQHIADEANKHRKHKIEIHPHRLRHTFGFIVRQKTGSDADTAALLGHTGLAHVGRYVRRSQEEREQILETLMEGE
jgi:integrase/recombinase XerD